MQTCWEAANHAISGCAMKGVACQCHVPIMALLMLGAEEVNSFA